MILDNLTLTLLLLLALVAVFGTLAVFVNYLAYRKVRRECERQRSARLDYFRHQGRHKR